jgi:hypothetical protein
MVFSSTFFPSAHSLFHQQQPSSLFHRHTPCSIGSSLQVSSIGIGNNTLNLIGNTSIQIHMPPPLISSLLYKLIFIDYQSTQ